MRAFSRTQSTNWPGAIWRRVVFAFTVLAFVHANYVTQTHIHIPTGPSGSAELVQNGGKAPLPDDPAHCPICQEYLLSGAYFIPPPVIFPLPVSAATTVANVVHISGFVAAFSHSWYGRAPPLT